MKKILLSGAIILCVILLTTNFYALQINPHPESPVSSGRLPIELDNVNGDIKLQVTRVWKSFSLAIQLIAVGSVVFAGLRYMFASADRKADIKQSTMYIIIGAVIIFGLTYIVDKVAMLFNRLTNNIL